MDDNKNQKTKQLVLLKVLHENSDEDHSMTATEIIAALDKRGISVNRKTLYADIKLLQDFGYDIVCNKSSQNLYFMGTSDFELPELKLLIDAVAASRFIPKRKSDDLIDKLSKIASVHQATTLNRKVYVANRVKSTNEKALYIVDLLHSAINSRKQITFQYNEYGPDKKKILKHNGLRYIFSPYEMAWDDDKYYVFGYSNSHDKIIKFRVDRIHKPIISGSVSVPKPRDFNVAELSKKIFQMYDGESFKVELLCDNDLMKVMVDKFGEDVETEVIDKEHFKAIVEVSASPTFYGWMFSFAGRMKVLSPQSVIDHYKVLASKL